MKKIVSVFLAMALAASACATLAGCDGDNKNYPVSVADITIETEPKDIVVLSDETADIISYLGYAKGDGNSKTLANFPVTSIAEAVEKYLESW